MRFNNNTLYYHGLCLFNKVIEVTCGPTLCEDVHPYNFWHRQLKKAETDYRNNNLKY